MLILVCKTAFAASQKEEDTKRDKDFGKLARWN
jgi:hypothetical protein